MNPSGAVRRSAYPSSTVDEAGEKRIVCCICQAAYTPSRSHAYLLQRPPIALESALMSMCHFCFRCRRPSCPACWDEVHGVCGQCALETGLPFRLASAPLAGAQFTPAHPLTVPARSTRSLLINVQPGRFQRSSSSPAGDIDAMPTRPDFSSVRPTARTLQSRSLEIDEIATRPDQTSSPARLDIADANTRPERDERARRRGKRFPALLILALAFLIVLILFVLVAVLHVADGHLFLRSLLLSTFVLQ